MGVIKSLFEMFIQTIPYLAVFLFGWAAVASAIQQDDLFPPLTFSIIFYDFFHWISEYDDVETRSERR